MNDSDRNRCLVDHVICYSWLQMAKTKTIFSVKLGSLFYKEILLKTIDTTDIRLFEIDFNA